MFFHTLNPVLVQLGPFAIRWYSLVYIFGFLLAYLVLVQLTKKGKIKNFPREKVDTFVLYLILGVILGARLFEVFFWEPGYYFANPIEIPQIWHGGMSFHGGLVGAVLVGIWFAKKHHIKVYALADVLVIPAALTLGFGRIANFVNAELWGKQSTVSWCVDYSKNPHIPGLPEGCRHPSQLYEALKNFFIFGVLMVLRNKHLPQGFLFWVFVTLYGYLRFLTNIWRADAVLLWGMSVGQVMSLIMAILGTIMLSVLWRKHNEKRRRKNSAKSA